MEITLSMIVEIGAALAVIGGAIKFGVTVYDFISYNKTQDERLNRLEKMQERILEELELAMDGLHATLDGLEQQGCNHTVPATKQKLYNYIKHEAHKK